MRRAISLFFLVVTALLALAGCGGSTAGGGTFNVFLSDAPMAGVEAVNIKIDRVEAHLNGEWLEIGGALPMIDLLDLREDSMLIASSGMPSGAYNQVRLFVSEASIIDANGTHEIRIPSNLRTGIKINIDATVDENTITTILLDFNVQKSVVRQGNGAYLLQPVIPAVIMNLAGTVSGTVTLDGNPVEGAIITATYTEGSSYPLGTEVNTSTSAADGMFKIWVLREGKYMVTVVYTDPADSLYEAGVADVIVTRETDNALGELELEEISP